MCIRQFGMMQPKGLGISCQAFLMDSLVSIEILPVDSVDSAMLASGCSGRIVTAIKTLFGNRDVL